MSGSSPKGMSHIDSPFSFIVTTGALRKSPSGRLSPISSTQNDETSAKESLRYYFFIAFNLI
jgi:hypothetical protein